MDYIELLITQNDLYEQERDMQDQKAGGVEHDVEMSVSIVRRDIVNTSEAHRNEVYRDAWLARRLQYTGGHGEFVAMPFR